MLREHREQRAAALEKMEREEAVRREAKEAGDAERRSERQAQRAMMRQRELWRALRRPVAPQAAQW